MGKLFLSGGGVDSLVQEIDSQFFGELNTGDALLYIPLALNAAHTKFEEAINWFTNLVNLYGEQKKLTVESVVKPTELADINPNKYRAIYIGGGNTYKLNTLFHESDFHSKLAHYIKGGGIVYGGSAGAIIFGKSIEVVHEEKTPTYQFAEGINLLKGYSILCHWDTLKNKREKIKYLEREHNSLFPLIILNESGGILYDLDNDLDNFKSIGRGDVFMIDNVSDKKWATVKMNYRRL